MIDKRDVRIVGSWCAGFWDGLFGNALDSSLSRSANAYMRGHAAGAFAREIYAGWV